MAGVAVWAVLAPAACRQLMCENYECHAGGAGDARDCPQPAVDTLHSEANSPSAASSLQCAHLMTCAVTGLDTYFPAVLLYLSTLTRRRIIVYVVIVHGVSSSSTTHLRTPASFPTPDARAAPRPSKPWRQFFSSANSHAGAPGRCAAAECVASSSDFDSAPLFTGAGGRGASLPPSGHAARNNMEPTFLGGDAVSGRECSFVGAPLLC